MKRRKFLKQIGFTGAAIVAAPTVLASTQEIWTDKVVLGDWLIDQPGKSIIYQGSTNRVVSLPYLHDFLKAEWTEECGEFPFEPIPMRTFGPKYCLHNEYKI